MAPVKGLPGLLLPVLLYLTLDLSLAAVPGAFVFDPDESVEGAHRTRLRAFVEGLAMPDAAGGPAVPFKPPTETKVRLTPRHRVEGGRPMGVSWWSFRPHLDPVSPSEDPH
jgi:hypothetical protein